MKHLLFSEVASAAFLLLLGVARFHYVVSASAQPADRSSPPVKWARHVPAYFVSTVWAIYVAWLVIAPAQIFEWDRWSLDHWGADLLGWTAVPLLAAGLGLFWYSHHTIGRYWSIRVQLKTEHRLVTQGPYRYVRHPLYTALFLGYLGTLFALQSWVLAAWFPAFVASYVLFAREEESVMEQYFGDAYRDYRQRTGMFLPMWESVRAVVQGKAPRWPLLVVALAVTILLLVPLTGFSEQLRKSPALNGADAQLKLVFEKVGQRQLNAALDEVDRLITHHPNFRLAHLVRGDLLLARAGPIGKFGNTGHASAERLDELRAEALTRLRAYSNQPPTGLIPRSLLWFDPAQKHAIVIDSSLSRVYVYENAGGTPRLVEDYYTTLGKYGIEKLREGDKKTPVGVYYVTSQIPGSKLPDLYGWGAFPINYPNEWDRLRGKTGYGIWLHGVPSDTYARAPWASDGCVALANPDIEDLASRVQVGITPVIIAERVEWLTPMAWRAERDAFMLQFQTWRADWESLDADRYLAHYARDFRSDGMDFSAWSAHKQRVNSVKTWIKITPSNVSVFRSPGTENLVAVTFDQDYRSSNVSQQTRKRQYWIIEDGRWKIAYEAPASSKVKLALPESFPGR